MKNNQENHSRRPRRLALQDFAGRAITLSDSPSSWRLLDTRGKNNPDSILILGLGGANVAEMPFISPGATVRWLEGPRALAARSAAEYNGSSENRLPPAAMVCPEQIPALSRKCRVFFYQPGLRLEPEFWGPLLARIDLANTELPEKSAHDAPPKTASAWLPGNDRQLLHQELKQALYAIGFDKIHEESCAPCNAPDLFGLWQGQPPTLALSVNFRGLDSEGGIFNLCRELDIPVAVWLVDNPWHILSGIRYPWWREAFIFVTDASFVASLRENGAKNVWHLPLAASQHMWRPVPAAPSLPPFFIGRSAFPDKESYFRGVRLRPDIFGAALKKLETGTNLPDWHWWYKTHASSLWPGYGRATGLGADICSSRNRAAWIREAMPHGLQIAGDAGWREQLQDPPLFPPVDYYVGLPGLYSQSKAILNVTSLLLPQSLNQRHFDVWAAGGLLLTDNTKGLEIFPATLTIPMTLDSPHDFGSRLEYFTKNGNARRELITAWREELKNGHSYEDRLIHILARTGVSTN